MKRKMNLRKMFYMKNLFSKLLLLLLILTSVDTFARWNMGMLRVREERGRSISVSVDGRRFSKIGRTVTIPNLAPGRHLIKVFAYNSNGYGYRNGLMLYQGTVTVKPGSIYYCSVFEDGMDVEENCCIDDYGHWNNNDNWDNWDEDNNCWNNNHNWAAIDQFNNSPRNNYDDNSWENYNGGLSIGRYNQMIEQVRKINFESSKVNLLNTMLRNTRITVAQYVGFMRELSFESTRLQFAKDNYSKLVDKRNAFMANDVFVFQSSKDEFLEFVNRQANR